eukprot:IDg17145t1
MHVLGRPMPRQNIVYSVLPKQMRRLKRLVGHHQPVYCSIYDFSGEYIITGSDDHQLKVWSTRTAYLCHTLRGHEREITDINADPARRIIVSAGRDDASVRVWDLVTGGDDGTVRLWNTRNFEQQALVIPLPRPNRRGQTIGTVSAVHGTGSTHGNAFGDSFPAQSPDMVTDFIPVSSPSRTPSRMSSPPPLPQQSNNGLQQTNNLQPTLHFSAPHPSASATLVTAQTYNALDREPQLQMTNQQLQHVPQVHSGHPRLETVAAQTSSVRTHGPSAQTGPSTALGYCTSSGCFYSKQCCKQQRCKRFTI